MNNQQLPMPAATQQAHASASSHQIQDQDSASCSDGDNGNEGGEIHGQRQHFHPCELCSPYMSFTIFAYSQLQEIHSSTQLVFCVLLEDCIPKLLCIT